MPVRSDRCGLGELFLAYETGDAERDRPGLQFMVSTGRVHGFESLEEQSLLLALDFTGAVEDVLPQPFTLRFGTAGGGFREHVPDFLAVFRDGSRWLFDVGRPGACAAPAVAPAAGDRPVLSAWRRVAGLAGRGERLMEGQAGLLELSAGSALLLGGREWTVPVVEAQYGRVLLSSAG